MTSTVADRRQLVLERLQAGSGSTRSRPPRSRSPRAALRSSRERAKAAKAARTRRFWDVRRGPAPVAFYVIAVVVAMFVMLGLVMVLSSSAATEVSRGRSPYFVFNRQVLWAALGVVVLWFTQRINLAILRTGSWALLGMTGAAMVLPMVPSLGTTVNGARAWIDVGPFSIQPSEFLKLGVVVFAADLLVRREEEMSDVRRSLRPVLLLAVTAAGACLAQGDLGSAIVIASIVLAVGFLAGVPLSPMLATGLGMGFVAVLFVFSSEYRFNRFTAFLDITGHRDALSYQTYQGFLAIADGGLTGSGVGAGNGKLGYLPLAHSDFIFAVVADELGLIGSIAVVGGFMLLVWFGIQAALSAADRFGMLLAGGIVAWLAVQAVINLGGVTGLMPVTGLTLPFFSAGGSSLFISMAAVGLLLNVARRPADALATPVPVSARRDRRRRHGS
ncbi:MAG: putative lipid II flippase FtsW [Desertimonas sp.]